MTEPIKPTIKLEAMVNGYTVYDGSLHIPVMVYAVTLLNPDIVVDRLNLPDGTEISNVLEENAERVQKFINNGYSISHVTFPYNTGLPIIKGNIINVYVGSDTLFERFANELITTEAIELLNEEKEVIAQALGINVSMAGYDKSKQVRFENPTLTHYI